MKNYNFLRLAGENAQKWSKTVSSHNISTFFDQSGQQGKEL